MKNNLKSRRYCFTIPNYTEDELEDFHILAKSLEKHRYICYGLEISPETGMKHIQGYVELIDAQRFSFLQKYIGIKRNKKILKFHIEIANGTASENKKYVSKEGTIFEYGEPLTQGSRTDMKIIKEAVKSNPRNIKEVIDMHGNNLQQVKFAESLQRYYFSERDPQTPPVVLWLHGPSGIGKTKLVYDTFKDICAVSDYKWLGTNYVQNECLLFDDFREFNLSFEEVLKITDRYPFTLAVKGGHVPLNSPYIIFTSPNPINQTFRGTKEDLEQIRRRIKEINLNIVEDISKLNLRNLDDIIKYSHDSF